MKTFVVLLLGAVIGIAAFLYFQGHHPESPELQRLQNGLSAGAESVKQNLDKKVVDLRVDDIKEELSRSGQVVRKKAQEIGKVVSDTAVDARITTSIKGKYTVDSDLSATKISVNTTDGMVTLSGSASSYDNIKKAMQLALETEGVREVVSTLQVR